MLLFLSLTGIFLSVLLLYHNARKFPSAVYLGLFFFLVSLYGLIQYALMYSGSVFLIAIFLLNPAFLTYLTGPMLFFYVRSILNDDHRLTRTDLLHFLPSLLFLIFSVPYMLTPWQVKLTHAERLADDANYIGRFDGLGLSKFIPGQVIFLSRPLLILIYALAILLLLVRFIRRHRASGILFRQAYMMKWISVLMAFLLILLISQLIQLDVAFIHKDTHSFFTLNLLQVLSAAGLTGLLISPFFFPAILYGLPQIPQPGPSHPNPEPLSHPQKGGIRKNQPGFETDYLKFIDQKIGTCMREVQPYLQTGCNMADISRLIGIPVHHLAYYFREYKQQSFNDFRNEWRIKHAKSMIHTGKARELTLEAIGQASGFSTRNTFFTSFKKVEGISPGNYVSNWELRPSRQPDPDPSSPPIP